VLDAIQELADGLAAELRRSVAVDDPVLRLLVSSAHYEDVDRARMDSLLGRRIDGPTLDYVMGEGVQQWREPTRLEANPALGVDLPRWCFPLRSKFELLGYMWLIDDGAITDEELAMAAETAQRIEEVLTRQTEAAVSSDPEVESLVSGLIANDPHERATAADGLRERGLLGNVRSLAVLVVRNTRRDTERLAADADTVRRGIAGALQNRLSTSYAYSATGGDSVLVVGFRKEPPVDELTLLATGLHVEIQRIDPAVAGATTIGIGSAAASLVDVRDAFDQAVVAAAVATDNRQVAAAWDAHPLEAMMRSCLKPEVTTALVPTALRALQKQPEDTLQVILTYLNNAGNVNATAELMHLHRTTVYYRLTKFRERTGLDLDDGQTRLLVHFWLTARPLVGLTD